MIHKLSVTLTNSEPCSKAKDLSDDHYSQVTNVQHYPCFFDNKLFTKLTFSVHHHTGRQTQINQNFFSSGFFLIGNGGAHVSIGID